MPHAVKAVPMRRERHIRGTTGAADGVAFVQYVQRGREVTDCRLEL